MSCRKRDIGGTPYALKENAMITSSVDSFYSFLASRGSWRAFSGGVWPREGVFRRLAANLCIALAGIDDTSGRTLFCERLCPGRISRFFRTA